MTDSYAEACEDLIKTLQAKGIQSSQVLNAIRQIPRHLFVEPHQIPHAYQDQPLLIGHEQTISQPYVVAKMTELLVETGELTTVLEVGTGSGFQAAVLAQIAEQVYSVERIAALYEFANKNIEALALENVHLLHGDGYQGWPEHAPFDGIIVTAAAEEVPQKLLEQMNDGGRMIIPVGSRAQQVLQLITREGEAYKTQYYDPVLFVPMLPGLE